jgi:ADP-ribose pyrophosphatase YjhB (NUDIX family)
VKALGLLIWRDHLLLHPANPPGAPPAWRALGGGVQHGEYARDAVLREFQEETGRAIEVVEPLPAVESIFRIDDQIGHEAVFPFHVRWAPGHEPDDLRPLPCVESDGTGFVATWFPLEEVLSERHMIYPERFQEWFPAWLQGRRP